MTAKPGFHPAARQEVLEAAGFYESERRGLGAEFLDEVERAIARIIRHPASSPIARGAVRTCAVARFPYSVVYSARSQRIYMSAIAHQSRRPFYWQDRL